MKRRRFLCLGLVGLIGCGQPAEPDDRFGPVPEFRLTERSGREVGLDDLRGQVWVAAFVFTRCSTSCPQLSGSMARLQAELADLPGVRLVSFSVDPEHDTPAVLSEYAGRFQADPERWWFLTGDRAGLYRLVREGFHLGVEANQGDARTPGNEVMHSNHLVAVDRQGQIRGYYDGRQPEDVDRLRDKVRHLAREQP
jgi:protein SCO1/2